LQAAILLVKLKILDTENKKRNRIAELYRRELRSVRNIRLPLERVHTTHTYHLFVIEAEKREELQKYLGENGIATLIHYPIPIHKQKSLKEYNSITLPYLEEKIGNILSLPIYPYLSDAEVKYVCKKIKEFYAHA